MIQEENEFSPGVTGTTLIEAFEIAQSTLKDDYSDIGKCYPLSETTQLLNSTPPK